MREQTTKVVTVRKSVYVELHLFILVYLLRTFIHLFGHISASFAHCLTHHFKVINGKAKLVNKCISGNRPENLW